MQIGVENTFCQEDFCKSITIEMGGVLRYFLKVSGSGVDLIFLENTSDSHEKDRYKIFPNRKGFNMGSQHPSPNVRF